MPICPGPCNTHYRHAYRAYQEQMRAHEQALIAWDGTPGTAPVPPEPPTIRPWLGDPIWCRRCTTTLRQELAELDDLASLYAARVDGHKEISLHAPITGTPTLASPSPAVEDLDELERWLRDWRAVYSGTQTPARQGLLANAITTGVAWLLARCEAILARPEFGVDFGRELHAWHHRLAAAARATTTIHRKPLRCPACHMLRLEHRDGDDVVRCANPGCGFELGLGEYEALVEQAVNQAP